VYATPLATTPIVPTTPVSGEQPKGLFIYRKEEVDDALFVGITKKHGKKNNRNERRNSKVRTDKFSLF